MANEESISRRAVSFVINYEQGNGRECVDVQSKGQFKGFDLFSFLPNKEDIRTIEVKGTQSNGIPDMFETEVTRNKKLIATHLYVVKFDKNKNPINLFIIPAKEFKADDLSEGTYYTVKSNFYTRNDKLKKFEVRIFD